MFAKTRSFSAGIVSLVFLVLAGARAASADAPVFPSCDGTAPLLQYQICEVTIPQSAYPTDLGAYTIPDVKVVFTHSSGKKVKVHAFYEKNPSGVIFFKARFNMSDAGAWSYEIQCTKQAFQDQTCDPNVTGTPKSFTVGASAENGFLRRDANHPSRFVYDSGFHPFVWGQTYYQMITNAVNGTGKWKDAVRISKDRGLNKIRMLLYPWWNFFDAYGDTEPFVDDATFQHPNHDLLNLDHWRKFDEVLNELYKTSDLEGSRMLAEIILFKDPAKDGNGHVLDNSRTFGTMDQDDRYLKYAVARFGAFPNVVWCLSNEWQATGKDATYWGNRAATLLDWDPWMRNGAQQRATSIHPKNEARFFFAGSSWPAHDVLQFSIKQCVTQGNDLCGNSDQYANFSIVNNLIDARPVANDEYGYVNSGLPGPDAPGICPHGFFTVDNQRRAMWAVAIGGGYGTFGDGTGDCTNPQRASPAIRADWEDSAPTQAQAYKETTNLNNFFRSTLGGVWWQMSSNNGRVSTVGDTMRPYELEVTGDIERYLVYAVKNPIQPSTTKGKFNISLPVNGSYREYTTTFYNPRSGVPSTPKQKRVTCPRRRDCATQPVNQPTQFGPNTFDDWALLISPSNKKSASPDDTVWVADDLPAGAITWGDSESWNWIDDAPTPISDSLAHQSNLVAAIHQHYFSGATETLSVSTGNVLYAYVYLDPSNPPSEVMLQWNDGSWEHRAYWGANQIGWGADGTNGRRYMGPLPAIDQWVRLQVPASSVGLEGHTLNGMAFTLFGGKATWDEAGKTGQSQPVCDPSSITMQPQSQTIIPGDSATLSVAVTGTGPFQYQFYQAPVGSYQNPTGISTATINTGPLYTTKQYWAEIIDNCAGAFLHSDAATITVQCTAAPTITMNPTTRVTNPGEQTTLSVAATQGVNYQWYLGNSPTTGSPISGETNPTLTVSPQSTTIYSARVTNGCGLADSAAATVCVRPKITTNPTSRTINPNQSTTLTVAALNPGTYQWYVGAAPSTVTPVTGGTGSSLTVTLTATTSYWVRVSNSCGDADSTTATVTVAPPPPPQITRMQAVSVLANSQQSITANWTQPTQPGTFLVAVISSETYPNGYVTFTAPAGWSNAVTSEWNDIKLAVYYLPNNAGARTSETFAVSPGFHDMTLYVLEYSGIMAANPLDKTGLAGNGTNNGYVQTGFTANTVQPKELVITALTTYAQTSFSTTPADGYTEIYDQSVLYDLTTAMYEKITTAIGSYGHGATVSVPSEWVGLVATFRATDTN